MSNSLPFIFKESLPPFSLDRMPDSLKLNGGRQPYILILIRLLSGTAEVTHKKTERKIKQQKNYFSEDQKRHAKHWYKKFPELIGENYTIDQLGQFISDRNNQGSNATFHKNILCEISYFFYYESRGMHTSAFIFLYRALEHISYAFPLIYVSKTNDFLRTYSFLKELMSENNKDKTKGELGFFKKFIETIFKDDPIIESSIDFHIVADSTEEQKKYYNILKKICNDKIIHQSTSPYSILAVKYSEVGSFIINLRNRFFHYMNGGAQNIESSNIDDVDQLFQIVNGNFMQWLSSILLAITSHNAHEYDQTVSSLATSNQNT